MAPIRWCCGSSFGPPGSPRNVVISRIGMRNVWVSDVRGLSALPSPEFWCMETPRTPPSSAPATSATASPSFDAPTYLNSELSRT